ncbi:SDR family NAD(P)-dependent oxidoreductase [Desertimonas flava]|uniref:SDR family NAD(P)-dependent oxidoreductase n=1 Tax=Desertimonas flava TaxID=2064846 RepID=UPI001D0C290C|nr:SDR family oxidoreductase [Desertimonas flava]
MVDIAPSPSISSLFGLDGRVAIVTGASSGLGARFARVLHAAGATVIASARRTERLAALAEELGDRVHPVTADVGNDDDCERLVATATEIGGRLDVLVNNAGIGYTGAAETEPVGTFRKVVEVNLNAVFVLSQLAYEPLRQSGHGSIINIASILGLNASAPIKQASYCASKGGVVNLTRELGCQWARRGIRVNAIAPGWFPTEMTEDMWSDAGSIEFVKRNAPMGRAGLDHELDGVLLFLASDASSYVVGQTIAVDGGWDAR